MEPRINYPQISSWGGTKFSSSTFKANATTQREREKKKLRSLNRKEHLEREEGNKRSLRRQPHAFFFLQCCRMVGLQGMAQAPLLASSVSHLQTKSKLNIFFPEKRSSLFHFCCSHRIKQIRIKLGSQIHVQEHLQKLEWA